MAFSSLASASMLSLETDDAPDYIVRGKIQREMVKLNNDEGQRFHQHQQEMSDLEQTLRGQNEANIVKLFGAKVESKPKSFALPIYDDGTRVFSGLFRLNSAKTSKAHQDFYEVGDFASAKVFYGPDGETVQTVIFFFRMDETYPELQGWGDLKSRLQWENAHLAALQQWVAEHQTRT